MSLLAGFPRRYLPSLTRGKQRGGFQGHEHIPAYDGADTAGLHGVQVVHDGGVDGLNLFARYTVRESARHFGTILGVRTSVQFHCVIQVRCGRPCPYFRCSLPA